MSSTRPTTRVGIGAHGGSEPSSQRVLSACQLRKALSAIGATVPPLRPTCLCIPADFKSSLPERDLLESSRHTATITLVGCDSIVTSYHYSPRHILDSARNIGYSTSNGHA